jgi:predicted ferric reductase
VKTSTLERTPPLGDLDELAELSSPAGLAWALAGALAGAALALVVLPEVAPTLSRSLTSAQPRAWWYLSRASALVAYAALSASTLLGLLLSTRFARRWPGNATAFSLHEHASVLGLALAVFHALVLLGDRHTPFALGEVLLPFGAAYRPVALGLGQLALYGTALLVASFHLRARLGQRAWRLLHFVSFAAYALALAHALAAGTDRVALVVGLVPAAAVVVFTLHRLLAPPPGAERGRS